MNKKALDNLLKDIGEQLGRLRRKKGYTTIKEFAKKYKLPAIQYWRIEKGKANVTIKSLGRILAIHKISFDKFFAPFYKDFPIQELFLRLVQVWGQGRASLKKCAFELSRKITTAVGLPHFL